MQNKIKFVRKYRILGHLMYDIVYYSGRVCTRSSEDIPMSVIEFISKATKITDQLDKLIGHETIYEA